MNHRISRVQLLHRGIFYLGATVEHILSIMVSRHKRYLAGLWDSQILISELGSESLQYIKYPKHEPAPVKGPRPSDHMCHEKVTPELQCSLP